ncbi:MAG: competence protein ComEC [Candidatus Dependentiae bacterium]|nr:competence protein ComEC [Candidatus Dependentiae bacterium]
MPQCVLDVLHTVGFLLASGLIGTSFFIYTQTERVHVSILTPLSPLFSVGATLGGIGLYHMLSGYCFFALLAAIGFAWHAFYRTRNYIPLHAAACALCAVMTLCVDHHQFTEKKDLLLQGRHTLHGLVIDRKQWAHRLNATVITINLTHLDYAPTSGQFKFFVYTNPSITVGDYAIFFHTTASPAPQKKDFLSYALRDHSLGSCFTPILQARIFPTKSYYSRWISWWYIWRENLYRSLQETIPAIPFTYISALFFGNKECAEFLDIRAKFTRWGLTHYLARSGLHISLLITLWVGVFRFIPLPITLKAPILFAILFLYDHLSWASISFNRALWLWFFYLGSWLVKATATPLFGLSQLSLVILLYNPWQSGCLDFQLSFLLTMILMIYGYYHQQSFLLSYCAKKKK